MKCLHCLVEFHARREITMLGKDADGGWAVFSYGCPKCGRMNLFLVHAPDVTYTQTGTVSSLKGTQKSTPIRPKGSSRQPCPSSVPANIAEDYAEACLVLPDSAKASAALSRRCLQNLLRQCAGVKQGDLSNEIQQVIESRKLPSTLAEAIDAVRNIGNFAAHPTKSQSTGEILPVEPGEAEWTLEVLEELFDHYYVKPARLADKRTALNTKLAEAGKPPMK